MIIPVAAGLLSRSSTAYSQSAIAANQYSFEELAEIYNQTRVDYIVPMPMNARRMAEYVQHYDVALDASAVSFFEDEVTGVAMLGLRDERAWITRLGVIPECRGRKTGSFLMEILLEQARRYQARLVQLEVIRGNDPAYYLFKKFGFAETRELVVIRRPPGVPTQPNPLPAATVTEIPAEAIPQVLAQRPPGASWVEETASLLNAGSLCGFRLELPDSPGGWIVLHRRPFQISHFVYDADPTRYDEILLALLGHVHTTFSRQDTIIENIPSDHPALPLLRAFGYIESFRRIEMIRMLD